MKIAYFNANLKRGQDGVTRVMYKMFEGALERGHEAIAITSTLPDEHDKIIPIYKVPSVAFPLQKAYRVALPGYHSYSKYLNDFNPDIIHVNSPCPLGYSAMKYGQRFGIPVVATYHTHFPTYPRYYGLQPLEEITWKLMRRFYNQIDRTFVPTKPILDELELHRVRNLMYVPNGVDLNLFRPEFRSNPWRERIHGSKEKTIVLFVSRLVWEKDLRVLAEAYSILRNKRNDFELVIVGDGHARQEFEQTMPGAHFLGYQSGKVLAESYASSDIFVFPSTTETFGLVTVEAMASGLVPVAAKIGGAAGIIQDGISGIFSKPFDGADMAQQVEFLIDHPEKREKLSYGATFRAQDFGWTHVLDELFGNYHEVIRGSFNQHAA